MQYAKLVNATVTDASSSSYRLSRPQDGPRNVTNYCSSKKRISEECEQWHRAGSNNKKPQAPEYCNQELNSYTVLSLATQIILPRKKKCAKVKLQLIPANTSAPTSKQTALKSFYNHPTKT